jgi:hypothetical protein
MLVYTPFALCFVTLHGVFMHFSELTYWRDATVPVPYFLLFLCFRKAIQEIFSELDKTKAKTSIFLGRRKKTKREPERGQRATTPGGGAPPSWPWQGVVRPPGGPLTPPLRLFKASQSPNPRSIRVFPVKVLQRCRRQRLISGNRSLYSGTLPGRGSAPGAISIDAIASTTISIDFTAISTNVVVSYDEEREVLPRGWGLY